MSNPFCIQTEKFIDPANSKFLDDKIKQKEATNGEENEFITDRRRNEELERKNEKLKRDNLIKAAIEKRITRSVTNKLMKQHTPQAIAAINNFIIPEEEKVKLKSIAFKNFHSIQLSQEENIYWNSFSNSERAYLLTGDSQSPIDFTEHQSATYQFEEEYQLQDHHHVPAQQVIFPEEHVNLFFDPSTSEDSSDSDDPNYIPFPPHPYLIALDNSVSRSLPAVL